MCASKEVPGKGLEMWTVQLSILLCISFIFCVIEIHFYSSQLRDRKQFKKLLHGASADLLYTSDVGRRSYASLISRAQETSYSIDLCVSMCGPQRKYK